MIISFVTYFDTTRLSLDFLHDGDVAEVGNWAYGSSASSVAVAGFVVFVVAQFE